MKRILSITVIAVLGLSLMSLIVQRWDRTLNPLGGQTFDVSGHGNEQSRLAQTPSVRTLRLADKE